MRTIKNDRILRIFYIENYLDGCWNVLGKKFFSMQNQCNLVCYLICGAIHHIYITLISHKYRSSPLKVPDKDIRRETEIQPHVNLQMKTNTRKRTSTRTAFVPVLRQMYTLNCRTLQSLRAWNTTSSFPLPKHGLSNWYKLEGAVLPIPEGSTRNIYSKYTTCHHKQKTWYRPEMDGHWPICPGAVATFLDTTNTFSLSNK